MRKTVFLSLCLFGLSFAALADDQNNAIPGNAPVPVQSFEQAGTPNTAAPAPTTPAPTATAAPAATPAPAVAAAPAASGEINASTLKDALLQLNKNVLQYQQQNDAKMLILGAQVSTNTSEITRLDKALTLLNQEVTAANPGLVQTNTGFHNWRSYLNMGLALVGGLIILFVILALLRNFLRKKPKAAAEAGDDTEGEYDYMGSAESMPAKLNLAHAYIKMENFAGAKEVLQEVIQKGTEEQKLAAKELLKKCN